MMALIIFKHFKHLHVSIVIEIMFAAHRAVSVAVASVVARCRMTDGNMKGGGEFNPNKH